MCIDRGLGASADEKKAYSWLKLAAEQGDAEAQTSLASRLLEGRGVPRNEQDAVAWYQRAAELGNARSMLGLVHCYEEGKGVCTCFFSFSDDMFSSLIAPRLRGIRSRHWSICSARRTLTQRRKCCWVCDIRRGKGV